MMIDEDIDYSKMKIFPGEMFTTRELKSRLNAMDVLIDPNVKEKRYYIRTSKRNNAKLCLFWNDDG